MPGWMIETFGGAHLDRAFLLIAAIPLPCWLLLILFPNATITSRLSHPLFLPTLLSSVWVYLVYLLLTTSSPPSPNAFNYSTAQTVSNHPLVFLVLWSHLQIFHLAVGLLLFRESQKFGIRTPLELMLCWILGPAGLLAFAFRLLLRKIFK
ncbi:MAG: abscisic acid-deficient protein Aba4 family protein [Puniceicoccaceae bacterium]